MSWSQTYFPEVIPRASNCLAVNYRRWLVLGLLVVLVTVGAKLEAAPLAPSTRQTSVVSPTAVPLLSLTETSPPDGARAMRKTVYALGIRLLVQNWSVEEESAELAGSDSIRVREVANPDRPSRLTTAKRMEAALSSSVGTRTFEALGSSEVERAVQFAMGLSDDPPSEEVLRMAYLELRTRFPGAPPEPRRLEVDASTLQALFIATPEQAGNLLSPVSLTAGSGVAFDQALIEGATAFLLDRARADLARSGLTLLAEDLEEDPAKQLLPRTLTVAEESTDRDPRLFLEALQAALASDFREAPRVLAQKMKAHSAFSLSPYQWEVAARAVALVDEVQRGTHPLLALSRFGIGTAQAEGSADAPRENSDLRRYLGELGMLAGVLYAGAVELDQQAYRPRAVLRSVDGRRLFLLCLQKELDLLNTGDAETRQQLETRVAALLTTLEDIVEEVEDVRDQFAQIRAANPGAAATRYADYVSVVTRAVRHVLADLDGEATAGTTQVLDEVERLLSIREAVIRGDYGTAAAQATGYVAVLAEAAGAEWLNRLFVIAAAIASAESAEGVYDALVLYTAPPGSFADKRQSDRKTKSFSLSINAYVGGIGGVEWVDDKRGGHGGAFIPVGIELSRNWGPGSWGLLLAPINFGTYADVGRSEPNYSLGQLFSPSAYIVVGLGDDIPVSLGIGSSFVPDLREKGDTNATRLSLFAGVDIPLFMW